jgi:hypothetical protein
MAVGVLSVALPSAGGLGPGLLRQSAASVHLVAAGPGLKSQCAAAASSVQVSVPCPTLVPSRHGVAMGCPAPIGAQPAPCVGLEGAAEYRVFFLDFEDFDVPRRYSGVGGRPVGHLFIEARTLSNAPDKPCVGGTPSGQIDIRSWRTTLYVCPRDSTYIQRVAVHGEGANVGHVLLDWKANGVEYTASVHGHTTANVDLLGRLVRSVVLVPPQN